VALVHNLPFKGPPKYSQIGIFGLKIYHLATVDHGTYCHFQFQFHHIRAKFKKRKEASTSQLISLQIDEKKDFLKKKNHSFFEEFERAFPHTDYCLLKNAWKTFFCWNKIDDFLPPASKRMNNATSRVTRLGEFSPFGRFFVYWAIFRLHIGRFFVYWAIVNCEQLLLKVHK
jgi:hypothetical protein